MDKFHETTPPTELKSAVMGRESSKKRSVKKGTQDDLKEIIESAILKSGYALSEREEHLAAWFFLEGAKAVSIQ